MQPGKIRRKIFNRQYSSEGIPFWKLSYHEGSWTLNEVEDDLQEVRDRLNYLEAKVADLEPRIAKEVEHRRSLQEDLLKFSTFEQICNSGMLRNFKIDSDSDFAQVILELLQQTMELQIGHLQQRIPRKDTSREEILPTPSD